MPRANCTLPLLLTGAIVTGIIGCGEPRPSTLGIRQAPTDYSSRLILNTTVEAVRPVAAQVFREHWRLDEDASTGVMLVSRPAEMPGRGESRQIRERIGLTPSRQRQVAELRLRPEGPNVLVQMTVQNQLMDTTQRASFSRETGDDRPGVTPIDRTGATSADTRESWTNTGRDRRVEQEVLAAISQAFASSQPE